MKVLPVSISRAARWCAPERATAPPIARSRRRSRAAATPSTSSRGFLDLFPFPALYVADLDAITGVGDNFGRRSRGCARRFPGSRSGSTMARRTWRRVEATLAHASATVVLGSELQADERAGSSSCRAWPRRAVAGFSRRRVSGTAGNSWRRPNSGRARVLAMTLARVGSGAGPDLARLAEIEARAGGREVYAAGGVRDARDLEALIAMGVAGALVATSLHDGRLTAADLRAL